MSCTEIFANAGDYIEIWRLGAIDTNDESVMSEIDSALTMANSDIVMALVTADACSCTLPVATLAHLKKLVVINAAVLFKASCGPSLTDAMRETYLTWITDQLDLIRTLEIDPCGETGSTAPAVGHAEQAMPGINTADIIIKGILKNTDS